MDQQDPHQDQPGERPPGVPEIPVTEDMSFVDAAATHLTIEDGGSESTLLAETGRDTQTKIEQEESSIDHEPAPMGAVPTDEDKFYLDWGRETLKGNIARINELQKALVTLSASFLGGSVVFYSDAATTPVFKGLVTAILLAGAIVSFLGSVPVQYNLDLDDPAQIQRVKAKTLETKKRWYIASASLLVGGLAMAALGLAAKYLGL